MCREGNTATWQLWLAILALYLGHWAAYRIVDAHDEEATETIRAAAEDAPPHHYAVATTGLPEHLREPAELEAFFEGVFERPGAVVRVVPCRHLSAATRAVEKVAAARRRRRRRRRARAPPATAEPPTRPPRTSSSSRPPARAGGRRGGRGAPRVPEGQGRARARGPLRRRRRRARSRPGVLRGPQGGRAGRVAAGAARALGGQGTAAVPAGLRQVHRRVHLLLLVRRAQDPEPGGVARGRAAPLRGGEESRR